MKQFLLSGCARYQIALVTLVLCAFVVNGQTTPAPVPPQNPETGTTKAPADKPANVEPVATGTIRGRVTADDGRIFSNATVMARAINGGLGSKTSQLDSEGRFTLEDVPAGAYMIFAIAPGYIDETMMIPDPKQWPKYFIG